MERVFINAARTENGYSCSCDLLEGWVVAHDGNFESFKEYVQESIDFYLECAREDGQDYPSVFDGEYELIYKFSVEALLAYYKGILSFSALEKITGINQKQLNHYAQGLKKPRPQQEEKIRSGLRNLANTLLTVTV